MENVPFLLSMSSLHNKSVQIYQALAFTVLTLFALPCGAQITFTKSFTKKLDRASLEYYETVEEWLHVTPLESDAYMQYDLVLQNDRNDFEVRYRVRRLNKYWNRIPQQVEIGRLLASIAANGEESEIQMEFPASQYLREHFNADQGLFAHFTPKRSFSEKPYGTLISLYAEDKAIVDVVLLYNDPDYNARDQFRSLRFANPAPLH